jgi:hypothetical protein
MFMVKTPNVHSRDTVFKQPLTDSAKDKMGNNDLRELILPTSYLYYLINFSDGESDVMSGELEQLCMN